MDIGYSDLRVHSSVRDEEFSKSEIGREVTGYWMVNEFKIVWKHETIKGSFFTFDTWQEVWVWLNGKQVYGVAYRWHEGFVVQRFILEDECHEYNPYVYYPDWRADDYDCELEFGLYGDQLDDCTFQHLPTETETEQEYLARLKIAAGRNGVKEVQSA